MALITPEMSMREVLKRYPELIGPIYSLGINCFG